MDPEIEKVNPPQEIMIRKSKRIFIFHSIVSILGLALVIYISITEKLGLSLIPVLFVIIFLAYTWYALRGLSDRSIQIKIDQHSISFKDGTTLKWNEIKHVFIERKNFAGRVTLGRGREPDFERIYLNIETIFSGQATGHRTTRSIDISGLEYTPGEILHFIELYQRKYRS